MNRNPRNLPYANLAKRFLYLYGVTKPPTSLALAELSADPNHLEFSPIEFEDFNHQLKVTTLAFEILLK